MNLTVEWVDQNKMLSENHYPEHGMIPVIRAATLRAWLEEQKAKAQPEMGEASYTRGYDDGWRDRIDNLLAQLPEEGV